MLSKLNLKGNMFFDGVGDCRISSNPDPRARDGTSAILIEAGMSGMSKSEMSKKGISKSHL